MTQSTFEKELDKFKGFDAPMDKPIRERVLSARDKALEAFEKTINAWLKGRDGDIAQIMHIAKLHFGKGG